MRSTQRREAFSIFHLHVLAAVLGVACCACAQPLVGDWPADRAICRPVPLRDVKLVGFLGAHVDANNRISLLEGLKSPIPAAFEARAAGPR